MATGSNQAHSIKTFSWKTKFPFGAPMIPRCHGTRAVAIADHADVRIELALDSVEGADLLRSRLTGVAGLGAADDNFVVANFVVIESVQRWPTSSIT